MKHTITMKEVQTKIKNGVSTFSKKDNAGDLVADLERCTSENADLRKEIERLRERLNDTRRYKGEFALENIDLKRKSENL